LSIGGADEFSQLFAFRDFSNATGNTTKAAKMVNLVNTVNTVKMVKTAEAVRMTKAVRDASKMVKGKR
jgi:hypothetical protein